MTAREGASISDLLHIATVHFKSPRWIPIQIRELSRNVGVPYKIWTSLEGIDPSFGRHFDRVVEQEGRHESKLNGLAREIAAEAGPDDLVMFLDGDAFPFVDPFPLIERGLAEAPLLAVRRAENCDEPQPHPCFCVTRVSTWRDLDGDWSEEGTVLLEQLRGSGTPWSEVLRTNGGNRHPVFFGVYGDAIYHHGAGFRVPVSRADIEAAGDGRTAEPSQRQRELEAAVRRNAELSEELFAQIERDEPDWLSGLRGGS
jgi:hypothetical protein